MREFEQVCGDMVAIGCEHHARICTAGRDGLGCFLHNYDEIFVCKKTVMTICTPDFD